jgi:hypothetical protein
MLTARRAMHRGPTCVLADAAACPGGEVTLASCCVYGRTAGVVAPEAGAVPRRDCHAVHYWRSQHDVGSGSCRHIPRPVCKHCHGGLPAESRLAFWARDYRLIAEKQETKIADLQVINDLIIRNMNTGILAVDEPHPPMNEYACSRSAVPKCEIAVMTCLARPELERWQSDPGVEPSRYCWKPARHRCCRPCRHAHDKGIGALDLNDECGFRRH